MIDNVGERISLILKERKEKHDAEQSQYLKKICEIFVRQIEESAKNDEEVLGFPFKTTVEFHEKYLYFVNHNSKEIERYIMDKYGLDITIYPLTPIKKPCQQNNILVTIMNIVGYLTNS